MMKQTSKTATILLANLVVSVLLANLVSAADTVEGRAKVRDADTIVVSGVPVRFDGVDAPELNTMAGRDGKRWMVNEVRDRHVVCELTGAKTYDRLVGTCFVGNTNLSAAVIAAGHALDCPRYSRGKYRHLETPAARSRISRSGYC